MQRKCVFRLNGGSPFCCRKTQLGTAPPEDLKQPSPQDCVLCCEPWPAQPTGEFLGVFLTGVSRAEDSPLTSVSPSFSVSDDSVLG